MIGAKKIKQGVGILAVAGLTLAVPGWLYARWIEPFWLHTSRHKIKVAELEGFSSEWKGFKAVFLSDWHVSPSGKLQPIVVTAFNKILAEKPHVVLMGGDYFDRGRWNSAIGQLCRQLTEAGLPVLGVMGNHDYFGRRNDHTRIRNAFAESGSRILVNEAQKINYNGQQAWVVGLDDAVKGEPDLAEAYQLIPRDEKPLFLLQHNPDYIRKLPEQAAVFMLSGHTHGGQINPALPPFHRKLNWVRFALTNHRTKYPCGWYQEKGLRLYVGRGLGTSGWPLRFNSRPELVVLEFV